MKTKLLLSSLLSFVFCLLSSQVPQGFNYQAVARDAGGTSIVNTAMPVRITIQSDSSLTGGTIFWQELHNSVTTNSFGLINVVLGKGSKVTGIAPAFSAIDWSITPKFIKTEINYGGWKMMGISRLWSVPYSMVAGDLGGPLKKLSVTGKTSVMDEALFEVKNKDGNTVFAVYNEGVRVYVADGAKGLKGGFAVGGFGSDKAESQKYFVVSKDSARIYIDSNPLTKKAKGGFAVGGYDMTKGLTIQDYLDVNADSVRIYTNNSKENKGLKGGFAVGGFDATKANLGNYLSLTPRNYFIGHNAGFLNTTGSYNVFAGFETGYSNTAGANNVFLGYQTGRSNISGNKNTMVGFSAGYSNSTGWSNTFIGDMAGYGNLSGAQNIFIGPSAGQVSKGDGNLFIGVMAGYSNQTGGLNVFLGNGTGYANTTAHFNTFLGSQAGYSNQTGIANTYIGMNAGGLNTSGSNNVFLGTQAGYNEQASNRLYIENSAADKNSALIYGEFDSKNLSFNAKVSIGKTSPVTKLDISGGNWNVSSGEGDFRIGDGNYRFKIGVANSGGGAGDVRLNAHGGSNRLILGGGGNDILLVTSTSVLPWTDNYSTLGASTNRWSVVYAVNGTIQTSDARLKTNIADLNYGIASLLELHPVSFTWKDDVNASRHLGLLAQDVEKVINEVVDKGNNPSRTLGINYSELIPVLIKGIQEQQQRIERLEKLVEKLLEERQ